MKTEKSALVYHDGLKNYDFGPGHPFRGDRFEAFLDFFGTRFAAFEEKFEKMKPTAASEETLRTVHGENYIETVRSASRGLKAPGIYKYMSGDNLNPLTGEVPRGLEEAARIVAGASTLAGELVAGKRFTKAIGIGGGLHHAKPDYGEGFCVYNDVAVCVENLKQKWGLKKILVLDTDAHAGNGTKEIFYKDPLVLFVDVHQDPRTIYPGTGFIHETGNGRGKGFTVNLPLVPDSARNAYQYIFENVIFPLTGEFDPDLIIRYGGSDPHYRDDLTRLGLTVDGFRMLGGYARQMAEQFSGGKCIDLMVSGYNIDVLPHCWSALISGLTDLDVDLSGLEEPAPPPADYGLEDARDMVRELKKLLAGHWKCMD